ncbi:putative uncharacterized protein [Pseudomonas sp. StFLB209]|nr:putative uncharacterized protein [Pseudomonas sp. StFLB209]
MRGCQGNMQALVLSGAGDCSFGVVQQRDRVKRSGLQLFACIGQLKPVSGPIKNRCAQPLFKTVYASAQP